MWIASYLLAARQRLARRFGKNVQGDATLRRGLRFGIVIRSLRSRAWAVLRDRQHPPASRLRAHGPKHHVRKVPVSEVADLVDLLFGRIASRPHWSIANDGTISRPWFCWIARYNPAAIFNGSAAPLIAKHLSVPLRFRNWLLGRSLRLSW